jgi:hypothetical protein
LDEPSRLAAADPDGFLRELAGAGALVRRTTAAVAESGLIEARDGPARATALIGPGSVVAAALALDARRSSPVVPVRAEAGLPRWVGAVDQLVAASDTGDDGALAGIVVDAGARGARVVGVCPPDTPLAAAVAQARGALVALDRMPVARFGMWSQLIGVVAAIAGDPDPGDQSAGDPERAAAVLDEVAIACRPDSELFVNPAKELALQLASSSPVALTTSPLSEAAARRFAEMALAAGEPVAVASFDPASALGLLGGPFAPLSAPDDLFRDPFDEPDGPSAHLVVLEDVTASPALPAAVESLGRFRVGVTELVPDPGLADPLSRLAYWVATLDFASAYLAVLNGVDPGRGRDQSWRQ